MGRGLPLRGSGPAGRAPASQAGGRGFKSRLPLSRGYGLEFFYPTENLQQRQVASPAIPVHAFVAQWIERLPPEQKAAGSNPAERTSTQAGSTIMPVPYSGVAVLDAEDNG